MPRWYATVLVPAVAAAILLAVGLASVNSSFAATNLVKGWNNVGYDGAAVPPSEALSSISGDYDVVYRWDAEAKEYKVYSPGSPEFVNTLTMLNSGDAIWLNLTAETATLAAMGGGTFSISASAFLPASDLAIYEKSFNEIYPVGTDAESQRYYAPISLPNGAVITSMKVAFVAISGEVHVRLDYTPLGNGSDGGQVFKLVETISTAGASPLTGTAFAHTVDNSANVYFLIVDLTGGPDTKLRGVSVTYTGG